MCPLLGIVSFVSAFAASQGCRSPYSVFSLNVFLQMWSMIFGMIDLKFVVGREKGLNEMAADETFTEPSLIKQADFKRDVFAQGNFE